MLPALAANTCSFYYNPGSCDALAGAVSSQCPLVPCTGMDVQEGPALVHPVAPVPALLLLSHFPETSAFSLAAQVAANHCSQADADGVFSSFECNQ